MDILVFFFLFPYVRSIYAGVHKHWTHDVSLQVLGKSLHLRPLSRSEGSDFGGLSSKYPNIGYSEEWRLQKTPNEPLENGHRLEWGFRNLVHGIKTEWDLLIGFLPAWVDYRRPIKNSLCRPTLLVSLGVVSSFSSFFQLIGSCSAIFVYDYRARRPASAFCCNERTPPTNNVRPKRPHNQDVKPRTWGRLSRLMLRFGPRMY